MSCISSCGRCRFCKEGRYGQCLGGGGWIFGHLIDGLQAEYARVPFADNSVYRVPDGLSDEQVLFLADILPTAYEVGVLNGRVTPGDVVAIVGAGPIGLAAMMTAWLYTPGAYRRDRPRRRPAGGAERFGADTTINNGREDALESHGADRRPRRGRRDRGGRHAADLRALHQAGAPGGRVANIGVHGAPATLHLEKLWIRDVTITTGSSTPSRSAAMKLAQAAGWTRRRSRPTTSRSAKPSTRTTCSRTQLPPGAQGRA